MPHPISIGGVLPSGFRMEIPRNIKPHEQYRRVLKVAQKMEKLSFDSCWIYDHFQTWPIIDSDYSILESWVTLSAIAQATSKIRLGTLVSCNTYRNPALLAKMASTLDAISNGRFNLGIGAGWFGQEAQNYGYEFPGPEERIRRLKEAITVIKKLWTERSSTFEGGFHRVINAVNFPKPIQRPHPPIYVGGGGKMTLRVAASLADGVNLDSDTLEGTRKKLDLLRTSCEKVRRPFESIEKTIHRWIFIAEKEEFALEKVRSIYDMYVRANSLPLDMGFEEFQKTRICGTASQCLNQLMPYLNLGVNGFVFWFDDALLLDPLRLFAKSVITALKTANN